jgi:dTDP-4-amino-4,6-dideoxygalactose transaminase
LAAEPSPEPAVPLFDLRLTAADLEAVAAALRSGWLTMGPRTEAFEREFAALLDVRHAIAVASGTAALHLAYLAAGVGPGDEVIVPAVTFVAGAAAARHCGAVPVLADVTGRTDPGVDPDDVAALIGPRTKALCAVHFAGYRCDTLHLAELCAERGIALIEDAAHHPLAAPIGLASCYSFAASKVLACGEGGLVATDDDRVAERVRSLRSHAMSSHTWDRHRGHAPGYDVTGVGFNYRLDEPRAALLSSRLTRLVDEVERRRALVRRYRDALHTLDGVLVPFHDDEVTSSSCYAMPIVLERPDLRDPLREQMRAHGIQTNVLYPAINEFSAYAATSPRPLPRAEAWAAAELTLPLFPHLTEGDQDRVVGALAEAVAGVAPRSSARVGWR